MSKHLVLDLGIIEEDLTAGVVAEVEAEVIIEGAKMRGEVEEVAIEHGLITILISKLLEYEREAKEADLVVSSV